jgi:hypothetical protein
MRHGRDTAVSFFVLGTGKAGGREPAGRVECRIKGFWGRNLVGLSVRAKPDPNSVAQL